MGKNKYKKNRFENIMLTRPFVVCFMAHREEAQNTIRQLQLHANCRNFFTKKDSHMVSTEYPVSRILRKCEEKTGHKIRQNLLFIIQHIRSYLQVYPHLIGNNPEKFVFLHKKRRQTAAFFKENSIPIFVKFTSFLRNQQKPKHPL